ncbi:MAG: DUF2332 domain-containing protein [Ktedonobacteraceae bacterium]
MHNGFDRPGHLNPTLEPYANIFRRYTEFDARGASPLYEHLSIRIAADPELLELTAYARKGQPVPNLLFGSVQFLLLKGVQHPLAAYYPSISGNVGNTGLDWVEDPYPYFRAFCLEHYEEIRQMIATRLVQTNEVRRCACLLPPFGLVAQQAGGLPLSLVEIGTSAGLNLLWDCYGYDYGEDGRYGNIHSPVQLHCHLRGERRPVLPTIFPEVASRIGIDLHPIDARNAEETLWLQALIWPEHEKRRHMLQNAIEIARKEPPQLVEGNALDLLPAIMAAVPQDTTLCLFHTFVLNQFLPEDRERLAALFADEATRRDLYVISIAWLDAEVPQLVLQSFENGMRMVRKLAVCSGHARWMEWVAN